MASALAILFGLDAVFAQPRRLEQAPPLSPAEGAREAQALVVEMLAEKPELGATNTGLIKIRDSEGNQMEIPLKIITLVTSTNWQQIYDTSAPAIHEWVKGEKGHRVTPASPGTVLTIIHTSEKTNEYFVSSSTNSIPKLLRPNELMVPFASSDFWIGDLGYEFLHWPKQTVIRNEMRHSRACKVLESINPNPASGGYVRVVCWITVEKPHGPVHADAYDASGRFKQFDPKNLEKVNGVYQVESVEMRNSKAGSHTILEFDRGD